MTPLAGGVTSFAAPPHQLPIKRENEEVAIEDAKEPKKRRIAPTLINNTG